MRLRLTLSQLVHGVAALHEFGLLHRDLKPSNVMVTSQGRVVILDFGLATALTRNEEQVSWHQFAGTPAYMAPEQTVGAEACAASDWYSVGVMIFEALTGRLPFLGTPADMVHAKQRLAAPAPGDVVAGVPDDLDDLCRQLLRTDPATRPGTGHIVQAIAATPSPRPRVRPAGPVLSLIGREEPLAVLSEAAADARGGRPSVTMIGGTSGIGKTALMRSFLKGPETKSALVIQGRCYERETVPFKTVDSAMDELCRHLAGLPAAQLAAILPVESEALARVFPALRRVLDAAQLPRRSRDIPDQQELRKRAFGAFRELLDRLIDWRSLIIFIDDLQWGDADSSALLAHVLAPPNPPPVCLFTCYRSDERDAPSVRSLRQLCSGIDLVQVRHIELAPLQLPDAESVARALLQEHDGTAVGHARRIAEESEGDPYFLAELVRAEVNRARDRSAPGDAHASLQSILRERIVTLADEPRRLLMIVALAGRPIEVSLAARAAGLSTDHGPSVRPLKHDRLIVTRTDSRGTTLETYHDRIRDVAAALLSSAERCEYHQRLAILFEEGDDEYLESAADHYRHANMPERVAALSLLAADRAAGALAFDRAARLYRCALDAGEPDLDGDVLAKLGDARANGGRGRDAATAYLEAGARAHGATALERRRRAAEQLLRAGHFDEGLAELEGVLRSVGMHVPRTPQRALWSLLPRRALLLMRGLRWTQRDARAIAPATITAIDICWAAVIGLARIDNIRAAEFQSRHLLLALRAGEPYRVARALCAEAGFNATKGAANLRRTVAIVGKASRLAEEIGHPHALGLAKFASALGSYYAGHFRDAELSSEAATAILQERCTGVAWELNTLRTVYLASLYYLGKVGELARRVPVHLREAIDRGDLYAATDLSVGRANAAWLVRDDVPGARDAIVNVMRQWSSSGFHAQHFFALLAEGQIAMYTGEAERTLRLLEHRWSEVTHSLILRVRLNRTELYHLRARVALATAMESGARESLLSSVTAFASRIAREPVTCGKPWAALLEAGVAACRGRADESLRRLDEAVSGFDIAHMTLYAQAARWRKGDLVGGSAGTALRDQALTGLRAEGVQAPERIVQMLAPGFPPA